MIRLLRNAFRHAGPAAALTALAVLAAPRPAAAQDGAETVIQDMAGRPALDTREVRARRGFDLFASGDGAMAGLRMGGTYSSQVSNYGPCSNVLFSCQIDRIVSSTGLNSALWFLVEWVAGAPPSQWAKIRNVAPSVANAIGGGYTAGYNGELIGRPIRFGPADNTLGRLFAGVTATSDGSCRDHTTSLLPPNPLVPSGTPLLATSDCTATWPSAGWQGDRTAPLEGYEQLFQQQGAAFAFDYWRVPDALKRPGPFAGTNLSTYGEVSDHNADILEGFGSVVPGGAGQPGIAGYPLGLTVRFETFNFGVPTLANVWYLRATLINRSEDVWGAPVNYDSLYFGFSPGTFLGTQNISNYYLPGRGMAVFHSSNARGAGGPCDDAARQPTGTGACLGNASASRGYQRGAMAIQVLKSPIGDLRNKLFTRTPGGAPCVPGTDPFCDPSHPLAGDTITFNHAHFGGFGAADSYTWGQTMRASFGYLSSTEANTLDGRSPANATAFEAFGTFRNIGYPAVRGVYNKYVPGVGGAPGAPWDYNKDGTPDTLYLDTCGPAGCVGLSSDTLPGGQINRFGNVGGVLAAGPFPLAAGDSTSWFVAFAADGDSLRAWTTFNAAEDLYLNFFLAPEAAPPATIASVQTTVATDQFGTANPSVSLFFSEDPEQWVDPFISKLADDFAAAPPSTPSGQLVAMNPNLISDLRALAADNLERLEIYKSCDGGQTFTADADCIGDPAVDANGNPDGVGWQAYAVLEPNTSGDIANVFNDGNVTGGRTFLYVIVGKTRGAEFILNTPTGAQQVQFAPSIRNTLSRSSSDANVASVYVPVSNPAGFKPATATITPSGPPATVPVSLTFSDNVVPGAYRAVFGNRMLVHRDSSISAGAPLGTQVIVQHRVTADVGGTATPVVIRADTFRLAGGGAFPVAGSGAAGTPVVSGDTARTTTTFSGLGFALVQGTEPLFGSVTLTGGSATPTALFANPRYPGFTVSVNNSVAGTFNTETAFRGPQSIARQNLLPSDTIVPRAVIDPFAVQWQQSRSTRVAAGGRYRLTWGADPWGTTGGFVINFANPAATREEIAAALRSRPALTTGRTDAATATLLSVPQTELVPVRLPFTVENLTYGRSVEIAMTRRVSGRIQLGTGLDTVSVAVPADEWIPGDQLAFIETVTRDSTTIAGVVLSASGTPIQVTDTVVTFSPAVLGCTNLRLSCNPVRQATRGATGYLPLADGDRLEFEYYVGLDPAVELALDVVGPVSGDQITAVTDSALALVRVVPNPFVIFSQYQSSVAQSRVLFTNLPPRGVLRLYTAAGQFVQQISWNPADLLGAGDLFYDLKSREGIDIATGLYFWVLTAPSDPSNPDSRPIQARGKFVVIRGSSR